jgi:uncharacterized protein YegL
MDIFFILDRSGSMYGSVDDTLGGFNAFVDRQRDDNPDGTLSLILFNHTLKTVYSGRPVKEVEPLAMRDYSPHGQTALLDAIGVTIKTAEQRVVEGRSVTVVILTDGQENSSRVYTKAHVNDLIAAKSDSWTFVFLGANQDAISEARTIGIPECSAMTFDQGNTTQAFDGLSNAVGRQISGESATVEFSGLERAQSQWPPSTPMI